MIDLRTLPTGPAARTPLDVGALVAGTGRAVSADRGDATWLPSARAELGEHPVWDTDGDQLLWVDVLGRAVHGWSPATGAAWSVRTSTAVSLAWPTDRGRLLLATAGGVVVHDRSADGLRPDLGHGPVLAGRPAGMPASSRFNDGACDPHGRLWVSSMGADPSTDLGSLYRVEPGASGGLDLVPVVSGLGCGNGIGWSPDGTVCYLVESMTRTVSRFAVDPADGSLHDGSVLVALDPHGPVPDGLVVDADGTLWVAVWDGGCLLRVSPDGDVLATWTVPALRVTCPGFGAPGTTDLFLTTARPDRGPTTGSGEDRDVRHHGRTPHDAAGAVLRLDAGVTGLPVTPFREGDPS